MFLYSHLERYDVYFLVIFVLSCVFIFISLCFMMEWISIFLIWCHILSVGLGGGIGFGGGVRGFMRRDWSLVRRDVEL